MWGGNAGKGGKYGGGYQNGWGNRPYQGGGWQTPGWGKAGAKGQNKGGKTGYAGGMAGKGGNMFGMWPQGDGMYPMWDDAGDDWGGSGESSEQWGGFCFTLEDSKTLASEIKPKTGVPIKNKFSPLLVTDEEYENENHDESHHKRSSLPSPSDDTTSIPARLPQSGKKPSQKPKVTKKEVAKQRRQQVEIDKKKD